MAQNFNLGTLGQTLAVNTAANTVSINSSFIVGSTFVSNSTQITVNSVPFSANDILVTGGIRANGSYGLSTQVLTSNGSGLYWDTATGGAYNYYNSNIAIDMYSSNLIDTSSSNVYVTLPIPFPGGWVKVVDGGGDKYTKPAVILRNGFTINGVADDLELDVPNAEVELVYTGTTWKVFT